MNKLYSFSKRTVDLLGATVGICLLAVPMVGCLLAIRLTSDDTPVLKQERIGLDGHPFICYKFRTMRANTPRVAAAELKNADAYLTPLGAILRHTSFDETLQLYNVLRGDMSLIGPRPLIPEERELHRLRRQGGVYHMRPGLSGLSQIHGRDTLSDRRKAHFDETYADFASPFLDLSILWRTFRCIRH